MQKRVENGRRGEVVCAPVVEGVCEGEERGKRAFGNGEGERRRDEKECGEQCAKKRDGGGGVETPETTRVEGGRGNWGLAGYDEGGYCEEDVDAEIACGERLLREMEEQNEEKRERAKRLDVREKGWLCLAWRYERQLCHCGGAQGGRKGVGEMVEETVSTVDKATVDKATVDKGDGGGGKRIIYGINGAAERTTSSQRACRRAPRFAVAVHHCSRAFGSPSLSHAQTVFRS